MEKKQIGRISIEMVTKIEKLAQQKTSHERYESYVHTNSRSKKIRYRTWLEGEIKHSGGDMTEILEIARTDSQIELARELLNDMEQLKKDFDLILRNKIRLLSCFRNS